jgi:hypothetical protein
MPPFKDAYPHVELKRKHFRPCLKDNIHVKSRPLVAIKLAPGVPNKGLSFTKGTVSFWFKKFGAGAVIGFCD